MNRPISPAERLGVLFSRLESLDLRQAPLKDAELTVPQLGLLVSIARQPGIRVREVAEILGVTMPTVSVGLHKLEQGGWLRRESDPQDGRAARLYLTVKARQLAKRALAFRRKRINEFMDALTAQEQEQLFNLLEKAIDQLEQKNRSKSKEKVLTASH
jgi:DNA-binding MarR family transcriptional regulator